MLLIKERGIPNPDPSDQSPVSVLEANKSFKYYLYIYVCIYHRLCRLFSHFNESVIYNTGTFVQFTKLCENYEPDQTVSEDRDSNQSDKDEQTAYINAIMNTTLMKTAASNLTDAGKRTSKCKLTIIMY